DSGDARRQMVMRHVAHSACAVEVARERSEALRLGDRDLHVIDEVPVPQRFDDRVGEAEHEQILNGVFAHEMIDAVDLLLAVMPVQLRVERMRAREIVAERFLHDDAMASGDAAELDLVQSLYDREEISRRNGEINDDVFAAAGARLGYGRVKAPIKRRIVVVACEELEAFDEAPGDVRVELSALLLEEGPKPIPPLVRAPLAPRKRDERERLAEMPRG